MAASPINNPKIRFWLPVWVLMGVIFFASSISGSDIPPLFSYQDLVYHFSSFFLLAYFFSRALNNDRPNRPQARLVLFTVLFGIIYGLSDELHQAYVPLRSVSVSDLLIDGLASFAGGALFALRRLPKSLKNA